MYVFMSVCKYGHVRGGALRIQKRALGLLALELKATTMSCRMLGLELNLSSLQKLASLLTTNPSLYP